ncbi:MAG: hypothetical protein K6E24_03960 [bacterium]|nr:hypothetical protein [bacterium]
MTDIKEKLINEISIKNTILKLISSWLYFALCLLLSGNCHTNLSFFQSINIFISIFSIIGIFVVLYLLSVVLYDYRIDSKVLFITMIFFAIVLVINYQTISFDNYKILGLAVITIVVSLYCYYDNKYLFENRVLTLKKVLIVLSIVSFLTFLIAFLTLVFRYKNYQSPNYDFGIFVNSFYNIKKCGAPIIACERDVLQSHFCVHLSPILYVVFPLFYIFPFPETV